MASFIIASIAYSKLDVTNWERYGQRMVEKAFFIGHPNTVFGTRLNLAVM